MELQRATAHGPLVEQPDQEEAGRRPHLVRIARQARIRIEAGVEPTVELGEVLAQAMLRVRVGRVDRHDGDERSGEQALDLTHGRDQPVLLVGRQRLEHRTGEQIAPAIEQRSLLPAFRGETSGPNPLVA